MALTKWSDNITLAALQGNYDGYIQSSLLQLRLSGPISSSATNGIAVYNVVEHTTYKVRLMMDTRFRVAACASIAMNTVMENYYRDAADENGSTSVNAYKEAEITTQAGQIYMPVFYWASGSGKGWSEVYDTVEVCQQLTGVLELTTPPTKTQYNVGEALDLTGMVVSVTWSDGSKEDVTDYTVSGYDSSAVGACTVVVEYQGETVSFGVTVAETSVPQGITLESLLNTTEGMEVIRDNVKNDDGTDEIVGVDWFTYAGKVCSTIYVSGNNWIGFGTSFEQLKICRRDGAVYYVYRQEGILDGRTKFLKIRVEGYTDWSVTTNTYKLIYEVFLFDDGCLYINIVQSPTNKNYIGTSSITDGTNTVTLDIPNGITSAAPVEITVESAGNNQVVTYKRYTPFIAVGIEIKTLPIKTEYFKNEVFDSAGLEVEAYDAQGNKRRVLDFIVYGFDSNTSGTCTVTITKDAYLTTFDVVISDIEITSITVDVNKTNYFPRQGLDLSTLVVKGNLSNGTMIEMTKGYTFSGFDSSIPQICDVTAIYGNLTSSFQLTVMAPQESVGASYSYSSPIFIGDACNLWVSEMTVEYENGEREEVTKGFEYTYPDTSTVGKKTIIVSYYTVSRTFEIEVVRYLNAEIGTPNKSDATMEFDCLTGILTIQGTGEVSDFQYEANVPGSFRDKLKTIIVSGDITGMQQTYLYSRSSVETVSLGEKIKEIPANMFMNCEGLKNIMFPSIESIGDQAFMGCSSLENLTLPDSISMLGARCFYGCGFTEFTIPDSCNVESLTQTFLYCGSLKEVYIGRNVKTISSGTFPGTDTPTITINNKENAIEGAPWDAPSGSTVVWLVKITSISITSLPDKTNYEIGEEFDPTGLTVSRIYSDGSTEIITDYTVSGFDSAQPGTKTITVTYNDLTTTFEVDVFGAATGIRISHYPNKVYYKIGDALDTTGLEVVAITEGGLERPITDYTLSDLDSSTVGNKQIAVSYERTLSADTKAVYFADFTVKVTATGDNPFEDNLTPYKIIVHWPNGEFKDLGNSDLAGTMTLQESICSNNYFIFGGCICNQLSFTTHSKQFMAADEDATPHGNIEVYVESKGTKVKIFAGTIDSGKRTAGLTQRNIIAYDYLYKFRNTDIAWWYKNKTADKNMLLTQKQFRDALFEHLGIEQVPTKLYYDNVLVPDTNQANEINVANILKDLCLQNSVFGWMNRDGKFEYLKLPKNSRVKSMDNAGNLKYDYYDAQIYVDTYESCEFTEGRIWYPKEFLADPYPGVFSPGGLTAQEAYEANVYYNRNSFFVGNADWLDRAFEADEYGVYTRMEPTMPICYGTTSKTDNQHLYRAQGYNLTLRGNPLNKVGDSIEITVRKTAEDGTELQWVIHSYIMSRTLKLTGDTGMTDVYSAKNGPYNGNDSQAGHYTPELSAELFRLRSEGPTISYAPFTDGASMLAASDIKKSRLRCVKSLTEAEYTALQAAGGLRNDTLYFVKE